MKTTIFLVLIVYCFSIVAAEGANPTLSHLLEKHNAAMDTLNPHLTGFKYEKTVKTFGNTIETTHYRFHTNAQARLALKNYEKNAEQLSNKLLEHSLGEGFIVGVLGSAYKAATNQYDNNKIIGAMGAAIALARVYHRIKHGPITGLRVDLTPVSLNGGVLVPIMHTTISVFGAIIGSIGVHCAIQRLRG